MAFGLGDPEPKQSIVVYPEDDEGTEEGGFMVMVLPPPVTFNLRFPGQYYDTENKLFYNLNRYYNPELGRYMEPDPIGLEGGLNVYNYAGANPVMYTDPSGLAAKVVNGNWVDDGTNFYSLSGGAFTDRLALNFSMDLSTLAPVPKLGIFNKIDELLFKTNIQRVEDLRFQLIVSNDIKSKPFIDPTRPKLSVPSTPNGMTTSDFGKSVIGWGSKPEGALNRLNTLSRGDVVKMQEKGLTSDMAAQWRTFYANEYLRNTNNMTAKNRVELMNGILKYIK